MEAEGRAGRGNRGGVPGLPGLDGREGIEERPIRKARVVILCLLALSSALEAEEYFFPSEIEAKLRDLDRKESGGLFRHAISHDSAIADFRLMEGLGLDVLPVSTMATFNTAFPFGDDDGALWQGRGFSGISRIGVETSWEWGHLRLEPEWWYAQNQEYETALRGGQPTIGDYFEGLDRLQAYGAGFYHEPTWGQSEIRLMRWGLTLGFGTENLRLGPADRQNLLLSNNASGFPLLDIGTDGPFTTKFGAFDARFFWGQTKASEWFDSDSSTNKFLWCGGAIGYSPPFLDSMSFGFIRIFHSPWSTLSGWKLIQFFDDTLWKKFRTVPVGENGEDDIDQILSFTWEWRVPETGSRAYLELGRNDHASDWLDFIMQPDHSIGYTFGLQQKIAFSETSNILLMLEVSDLGNNIGTTTRTTESWYRHILIDNGGIDTGYTENGQLMGAPEGPGSNTQRITAFYVGDGWFAGFGAQREAFDADRFYTLNPGLGHYLDYDLIVSGEARGGVRVGDFEIGGSVGYAFNWNRNFVIGNDVGNWRLQLSAKFSR
jgi:hypothetical protein